MRKLFVLAALPLFAMPVGLSALPAGVAVPAISIAPLAVVGDSITVFAEPQIEKAVPGAKFYAHVGYTVPDSRWNLALALGSHPRVLVLNLGTNDAIQATRGMITTAYASALEEIHAARIPCVALVTVNRIADLYGGHGDTFAAQINAEIATYAALYGWAIVDWNAEVETAPVVVLDGIHPDAAGKAWFADQYAAVVRGCASASEVTASR